MTRASQAQAAGGAAEQAEARTVLRFLGPGDPDPTDPASPFTIRPGQILRLLTRTPFGYRASVECSGPQEASAPVPDLAVELPTEANGGISPDGTTYLIRLRSDVDWDTPLPRRVTAGDIVRGLKRAALPTAAAFRHYLTETIEGMAGYCADHVAEFGDTEPTAPALAQFSASRPVAGLSAVDEWTLRVQLVEPARDLPHILATAVAAAAPREYDYYLPDSRELLPNTPSAGPYRFVRTFAPGPDLLFEPNPRWRSETDPIRQRYADAIQVRAATGTGRPQLDGLDVAWTFGTVSWHPGPADTAGYPGQVFGPYLVFNLRNPTGDAVRDLAVRQGLAAAIDQAAVVEVVNRATGGAARPQHGMLLPGSPGHAGAGPGSGAGSEPAARRSDHSLAGELLARAGQRRLRLVLAVPRSELHWRVARAIGESLWPCGITMHIRSYPSAGYHDVLQATAGAGGWDFALADWAPLWPGDNGRTAVAPLLRGGSQPGVANAGWYSDESVDRCIASALREPDTARAAALWQEVDAQVARDLPVLPLAAMSGPAAAARCAATSWLVGPSR